MPRISVVIPVFNGEKTLQETIASVLNQTFSDLELLVIDDGSQDATPDVLAGVRDPRVRVFSRPHSGASSSRNYGISQAQGEMISFLDADDLWTPDKLTAQLKALEANPQAAVAYSWTDFIDESGRLLWPGQHITANGDVYARLLISNFIENGSNPLIRIQAVLEVGGYDVSLDSFEDWDLWLRLAKRFHFVTVPMPHVLYRYTSVSKSANVLNHEAKGLKAIALAYARTPESLQHLKRRSYAWVYEYLTSKVLDCYRERTKGRIAIRFLWKALRCNPALLMRARFMASTLFEITVNILLPPRPAEITVSTAKRLAKKIFPLR